MSFTHTKVVATIGPASEHRIGELIEAGMSVARINFSHGEADVHRRRVAQIREEAQARKTPVAIMADIQGPKMRLGLFEESTRSLGPGDRMTLLEGDGTAGPDEVFFNCKGFADYVQPGHRVFLADGAVEVLVETRRGGLLEGVVRRGGVVGNRKGFHLPDSELQLAMPTEKDVRDLEVCRELEIDMIGASFISDAADVRKIRELAPQASVVAKIERLQAVEKIDEILRETDGIMVARGDLGVEVDLERLPLVQKDLIKAALGAGKFTITATEMLESMVHASRPTRAEVTDIANAVLDGTDAVMLSAETAVGKYPVEAVQTMVRIAQSVEESKRYRDLPRISFRASEPTFSNALAKSSVEVSIALGIRKIIVFTETGNTVRLVSRYRPPADVIALSPHPRTVHKMNALAHVHPLHFPRQKSLEDMLTFASEMLIERGLVELGEEVIYIAGVPPGVSKSTNLLKLHRIGERARLH